MGNEMKYPILHNDKNSIIEDKLLKAILFFKGQEYTYNFEAESEDVDEPLIYPHSEIIDAILNDVEFCEGMRHWSDKTLAVELQNVLQNIEKKGKSIFLPRKYWTSEQSEL